MSAPPRASAAPPGAARRVPGAPGAATGHAISAALGRGLTERPGARAGSHRGSRSDGLRAEPPGAALLGTASRREEFPLPATSRARWRSPPFPASQAAWLELGARRRRRPVSRGRRHHAGVLPAARERPEAGERSVRAAPHRGSPPAPSAPPRRGGQRALSSASGLGGPCPPLRPLCRPPGAARCGAPWRRGEAARERCGAALSRGSGRGLPAAAAPHGGGEARRPRGAGPARLRLPLRRASAVGRLWAKRGSGVGFAAAGACSAGRRAARAPRCSACGPARAAAPPLWPPTRRGCPLAWGWASGAWLGSRTCSGTISKLGRSWALCFHVGFVFSARVLPVSLLRVQTVKLPKRCTGWCAFASIGSRNRKQGGCAVCVSRCLPHIKLDWLYLSASSFQAKCMTSALFCSILF